MGIEVRGNSHRAKVYDGKRLVIQKSFGTRAEAVAFHKAESAKLTLAALPAKGLDDFTRMQAANSLAALRAFDLRREGFVHVSELPAQEPNSLSHHELRTLGDIATRYLREVTPRKKGREQETWKLTAILLPHKIAKRRVADLTKRDFQNYRDHRLSQVSPSTTKKELHLFHAIVEHAREEWSLDLTENPASIRAPAHSDVARDRRLLDGEEARLLAACDPLMRDAVTLALDTAMRQGEILKARPAMLRAGGYLALPCSITKSGKGRDVPLTERAAEIIARRTKDNDPYFKATSANAFRMAFIRTVKRAKIVGMTFHDLRHEATSRLFESGRFQQAEIMRITGHESDVMVRRYLKTSGKELATRMRQDTA